MKSASTPFGLNFSSFFMFVTLIDSSVKSRSYSSASSRSPAKKCYMSKRASSTWLCVPPPSIIFVTIEDFRFVLMASEGRADPDDYSEKAAPRLGSSFVPWRFSPGYYCYCFLPLIFVESLTSICYSLRPLVWEFFFDSSDVGSSLIT